MSLTFNAVTIYLLEPQTKYFFNRLPIIVCYDGNLHNSIYN
jgi:hypothetical protein